MTSCQHRDYVHDEWGSVGACYTAEESEGGHRYGSKQTARCQAAIVKANRVLDFIRREIDYNSPEVVLTVLEFI